MSKDDKSLKLQPRLRFPEFKGGPEWDAPPMSDLYGFRSTNSLSRDELNYDTGSIYNIHYGDIHTKFQTQFHLDEEPVPFIDPAVAEELGNRLHLCREGDIILADASEDLNDVGKAMELISLGDRRVVAGTHTIHATRLGNNPVIGFGGYLFKSAAVRRGIHKEAQGAKVYGISSTRIGAIRLPLPHTSAEQRKIAECLGSLDDWIAAETDALAELRRHKTGLMQHLFPLPGENVPRLRFPDFMSTPVWNKQRIGDVLEKKAKAISIDPNVSYREIGVRSHGKGLFHKEAVSGSALGAKRVFHVVPGAVVFNIVFAWERAVAVTSESERGFIASHRFPMFLPRSDRCDVRFMQRFFLTPTGRELLNIASPGGAGRNRTLNQSDLSNLYANLPNVEEQRHIADCLAWLDACITAQRKTIETLHRHKRGLMQQLFPAPSGIAEGIS